MNRIRFSDFGIGIKNRFFFFFFFWWSVQKEINKNTYFSSMKNLPKVFEFSATSNTVLCYVFPNRKEQLREICHVIASIVDAKDNAIGNKHQSV